MKLKILAGAATWVLLISALHVQLNVGWRQLAALFMGRQELLVGFLPVT